MADRIIPADQREQAAAELHRFLLSCMPGKQLKVSVVQYRDTRSNAQNNALWGVAYPPLVEHTGNEPETLHEYYCGEFFGWVKYEVFGRQKLRPRRTTTIDESGHRNVLDWKTFSDFYEFIQRHAAEVGVWIPDPDPMWRIEKERAECEGRAA